MFAPAWRPRSGLDFCAALFSPSVERGVPCGQGQRLTRFCALSQDRAQLPAESICSSMRGHGFLLCCTDLSSLPGLPPHYLILKSITSASKLTKHPLSTSRERPLEAVLAVRCTSPLASAHRPLSSSTGAMEKGSHLSSSRQFSQYLNAVILCI